MPMIRPETVLRALRQAPMVLSTMLKQVPQEVAREAKDGPDGWNVVSVVCHLRDYEEIFFDRTQKMLQEDNPTFSAHNPDDLALARGYANQNLAAVVAAYAEKRQRFVEFLEKLSDEEWQRPGIHPRFGQVTLLDHTAHMSLHDMNHFEQIAHTLAMGEK